MLTRRLFASAVIAAPTSLHLPASPAVPVTIREHFCMGCCCRDAAPEQIAAAFNKHVAQRAAEPIRRAIAMVRR